MGRTMEAINTRKIVKLNFSISSETYLKHRRSLLVSLFKYIRSRPFLWAPDVDGWRMKDQFQHIFLSSDPDNDELKSLIHDDFYMTWLTGAFSHRLTGSYLIVLDKPNGVIRGISPVDIWRRTTDNVIVQTVQPVATKVCIETYPNFKQLTLSKDGVSHFVYLLNSAYYDPSFTSAPDTEDPMVIINLDISNAFGTLCTRLVLDHLSGKASRDYACGINTDTDFETVVHELETYFGFFRLQHTCETILRFYSYDGTTNYVRCRTGGVQGYVARQG
jgi:hypothetical protein